MATAWPASPPLITAALPATTSSAQLWQTRRPVAVSSRSLVGWPHCWHVPALNPIAPPEVLILSVFRSALQNESRANSR
jgi:hypothetical protein